MEISNKSVMIAVIPVFITVFGGMLDNAVKWRSEMEQKKYDRQTRLIDKIMEINVAEERIAMANFYLSIGVFDGNYREEIDKAIEQARLEMVVKRPEPVEMIDPVAGSSAMPAPSPDFSFLETPQPKLEIPAIMPIPKKPDWAEIVRKLQEDQPTQFKPLPSEATQYQRQDIPSVFSFDR